MKLDQVRRLLPSFGYILTMATAAHIHPQWGRCHLPCLPFWPVRWPTAAARVCWRQCRCSCSRAGGGLDSFLCAEPTRARKTEGAAWGPPPQVRARADAGPVHPDWPGWQWGAWRGGNRTGGSGARLGRIGSLPAVQDWRRPAPEAAPARAGRAGHAGPHGVSDTGSGRPGDPCQRGPGRSLPWPSAVANDLSRPSGGLPRADMAQSVAAGN